MPKRTDIHTILIIGSGPIVIVQGCEFDYSGVQACRALKEEGYRIVLINSNPATIMTDPEFADATYIEPITPEAVEKILIRSCQRPPHQCAAADAGRADRLERGDGVLRPRHPAEAQRKDDRRRPRGDLPRRGPAGFQG